jgi:hypothetical protein
MRGVVVGLFLHARFNIVLLQIICRCCSGDCCAAPVKVRQSARLWHVAAALPVHVHSWDALQGTCDLSLKQWDIEVYCSMLTAHASTGWVD